MSAARSILGPLSRTLVAPRLQKRSLATSPHLAFGFQDPHIPGWTSANHGNSQQQHQTTTGLVPIVIEQTGRGERSYDIYSRFWIRALWEFVVETLTLLQVVKGPDYLSNGPSWRLCVQHSCCPAAFPTVWVCQEANPHVGKLLMSSCQTYSLILNIVKVIPAFQVHQLPRGQCDCWFSHLWYNAVSFIFTPPSTPVPMALK